MPSTGLLPLDYSGNSTNTTATYNFALQLPSGDAVLTSPAPSISQIAPLLPWKAPALNFSSVTVQTGNTTVAARVSVIGAVPNALYKTSCTVQTLLGNEYVCDLWITTTLG